MNVPIIGQKRIPYGDFPLLTVGQLNDLEQLTIKLLEEGVPPEIPAVGIALGFQAQIARTLQVQLALLNKVHESIRARADFDILEHSDPSTFSFYTEVANYLQTQVPPLPTLVRP